MVSSMLSLSSFWRETLLLSKRVRPNHLLLWGFSTTSGGFPMEEEWIFVFSSSLSHLFFFLLFFPSLLFTSIVAIFVSSKTYKFQLSSTPGPLSTAIAPSTAPFSLPIANRFLDLKWFIDLVLSSPNLWALISPALKYAPTTVLQDLPTSCQSSPSRLPGVSSMRRLVYAPQRCVASPNNGSTTLLR